LLRAFLTRRLNLRRTSGTRDRSRLWLAMGRERFKASSSGIEVLLGISSRSMWRRVRDGRGLDRCSSYRPKSGYTRKAATPLDWRPPWTIFRRCPSTSGTDTASFAHGPAIIQTGSTHWCSRRISGDPGSSLRSAGHPDKFSRLIGARNAFVSAKASTTPLQPNQE
jgi:hypothetical protein